MGDIQHNTFFLSNIGISSYIVLGACFSIALLVVSLVIGQLFRLLVLGQGGGLLFSDGAAVMVLLSASIVVLRCWLQRIEIPRLYGRLVLALSLFMSWALFGLIINMPHLTTVEFQIALAYLIRLAVLLCLLPALLLLCSNKIIFNWTRKVFLIAIFSICVLGLVQLVFLPDISFLTTMGWDPHQGRLVSSWLDPNLLGGFFLVVLPFTIAYASDKKNIFSIALSILVLVCLLLTQSRTSLLVLTIALIYTISLRILFYGYKPRQFSVNLVIITSLVLIGFFAWISLGDRFVGLLKGDATTELRFTSLAAVVKNLALPHSVVGIGYNTYQFMAQREGYIQSFAVHSRAGSDNSLLNIWVTTGIVGVMLFLFPWVIVFEYSLKDFKKNKNMYALAFISSFLLICVQSQAVNSLLYGHILITLEITGALAICRS